MGLTNEFERDLNAQAGLKRPGRIDLRVLQNTADAGDGHPGLQRCFRNYLHEGGMEKDLDLIGYSIKGTSVDINNAELQQLSNIGSSVITTSIWSQLDNIEATTISPAQWVFVGEADQAVKQADSPTFVGLTLSADVVTSSTFDGVNVGDLKTAFDNHKASSGVDHTFIDQDLRTTFSPVFVGLTLSADLVTTSTVDSVDIAGHDHSGANQGGTVAHSSTSGRTANDHHDESHVLSGGNHTGAGLTIGHVIRATGATTFVWAQLGHGDLSAIGSNAHSVIDSHLSSTVKHSDVQCIHHMGNGFVLTNNYGPGYKVACSNTTAWVSYSFYITTAGSYNVVVAHYCSISGSSDPLELTVKVAEFSNNDYLGWTINAGWSPATYDEVEHVRISEYTTTSITAAAGDTVVVELLKTGTVGGRSGDITILSVGLERQ